jgi:peptide chain release factor 1
MLPDRLIAHLDRLRERADEIDAKLLDPSVAADHVQFTRLSKERASLEGTVGLYRRYHRALDERREAKQILEDPTSDRDMRTLAEEQVGASEADAERLAEQVRRALVEEDADDRRDAILEIRAGTGGEEAALFAADLMRMYQRLADRRGWKMEVLDGNPAEQGGLKEVKISVAGANVFRDLRFESGVHRVQRVPKTETQGRIHTSTATVAVLPQVEEVDIDIKPEDLEVQTMRAGGPGGQNVNKTSSAVRMRHKPSGLEVKVQADPSQHKNRALALRMIRAKLYEMEEERRAKERSLARRNQVGTGDRSEKIRTYNFKENRVTDHRVGFTAHNLDQVLDGRLDEILETLRAADREARLANL